MAICQHHAHVMKQGGPADHLVADHLHHVLDSVNGGHVDHHLEGVPNQNTVF